MTTAFPEELLAHLSRVSRLSRTEARHVVEEICAYFTESLEAYVTRRHHELQRDGLANRVIYRHIAAELDGLRFPAPPLTERQIRRLIYG